MSLSEFLTTHDDDADEEDLNDAIMRHADHDAVVDRLLNGVSLNPTSVMESLKEQERELYHQEQQQTQRPVQPVSHFGLDPRSDVTYITDQPFVNSERTHDHIRLLQQNNASEARLRSIYHARFK
jgi:hypothetical protein